MTGPIRLRLPLRHDPSRRRFLRALGAAGAITATGGALLGCSSPLGPDGGSGGPDASGLGSGDSPANGWAVAGTDPQLPVGRRLPGAVDGRVLVVVDLLGGNDGLSTLIPHGDDTYHRLRPTLAVPAEDVLRLDGEAGLHPSLARLHRRGVTTVEGVGPVDGDLSHFAMTERWQRGDVTGANSLRTGFLGRLVDAVDEGSPLTGLSLAGPSPHLLAGRAATMALTGPDDLWFLEQNDWFEVDAYRAGLAAMIGDLAGDPAGAGGGRDQLLATTADSYRELLDLATDLSTDDGDEWDWDEPMLAEGGELGQRLRAATDLLAADIGVRVVYVADGDYDTHQDHHWRQADNLARLDAAVAGFLDRVETMGMGDRVLVATVSEFGRRVPENAGGLDHGSASTMIVAGPVGDRRLGDRPALDDLDDDGNLRVAVGFDRYLAGLAQSWMGVEAASVLPGEPEPIELV